MLVIPLAIILVAVSLFTFYDLNGGSLDPTDRELRLVVTGSMDAGPTDYPVPTIREDSIVMIHQIDPEDIPSLEVGDIVAYESNSRTIVHRLVSTDVDNSTLTLKGDANSSSETVHFDSVIGEVVGTSYWLGFAVTNAKSMPVLILAMIGCAAVLLLSVREILLIRSEEEEI